MTPIERGATQIDPDAFSDTGAYASERGRQMAADDASSTTQAVLSAALNDPNDPDWLGRTISEHVVHPAPVQGSIGCRCGWTPDWTGHGVKETWVPWIRQFDRHVADAVRAAILGKD